MTMELLEISSYADFQATPEAVLVYRLAVKKGRADIERSKRPPGARDG